MGFRTDGFTPHLTTHSEPAYCIANQWIVTNGRVMYVESVERPWRDQEARSADNGRAPCLLFVMGEQYPWYVKSGHDRVACLSLPPTPIDS